MGPVARRRLVVPPGRAALRGATVGALWASALLAFLAAARVAGHPRWLAVEIVGHVVFLRGEPQFLLAASSVISSVIAGAALGVAGRYIPGHVWARSLAMVVLAFPALSVVAFLAGCAPHALMALSDPGKFFVEALAGGLIFATYGMDYLAPLAAVPAVLAMLMLEGWTRPTDEAPTGLARPEVRQWVIRVLLVATAALMTFAASHWPRL